MAADLETGGRSSLVEVLPGPEEVAERAAGLFVMAASSAISARGSFNVALSGGSTPRLFFETLSRQPYTEGIRWEDVHVFFADERCVPPNDDKSNFKMAHESLLSKVSAIVHRIEGELGAEEAARRYANELMLVLGKTPVLDMVFLGMGEDGHTASLFPGSSQIDEKDLPAVAVPEGNPPRVSITMPVINSARSVVFLVTGEGKAEMISRVLGVQRDDAQSVPAGLVTGRAIWLLDREAAPAIGD